MVAVLAQFHLANRLGLLFSTSPVASPSITLCSAARPSPTRKYFSHHNNLIRSQHSHPVSHVFSEKQSPASSGRTLPFDIIFRKSLCALHGERTATAASLEEDSVHSRRDLVLATLVAAVVPSVPGLAGAGPFPMMEEPDLPRFQRTATGVKIQEVVEGEGPVAAEGDTVEFNYVCRRSNGYFVYSTVDQFSGESRPVVLPLGAGKMIPGLREVLLGMKPGGKRRAVVPPEVGYISADLEPQPREFGPQRSLFSHTQESLLFEVQLLKIK